MAALTAVLFDLGGVVMDSPLHAVARFEAAHGLPEHAINRAVAASGPTGAWARLECGELTVAEFCGRFEAECRAHGFSVDAAALIRAINANGGRPRPQMLEAIRRLRRSAFRVGALTNNWHSETPRAISIREHFDAFVESRLAGMRKPDPRIYQLACRELGVAPDQVAFLDDIGANLKAARALGMTTVKVVEPDAALRELGGHVGIDLLG
ncbi:MAG: HAD family phosphatase [Candidatus Rokubacteria bacterium]|nr:HAD family phosphatase [Candidatus Rokubacteria bacterium]